MVKKIRSDLVHAFQRGSFFGAGIASVILVSSIFAVTVTGVINTFKSGDVLTSAALNENFTSLKTAIETLPPQMIATANFNSDCSMAKIDEGGFLNGPSSGGFGIPYNVMAMPAAGTVTGIQVMIYNSTFALGDSTDIRLYKNGLDTGISMVYTASSPTPYTLSVSIPFVKGDQFHVVAGCGAGSTQNYSSKVILEYQ